MVAVALMSAKGSPGCTTTALALSTVWPEMYPDRRLLLAECDAAGGDITSGYLRGQLDDSRGLAALAAQRSSDEVAAVWDQLLAFDDSSRRLFLPGLAEPRLTAGLPHAWTTLATALPDLAGQDPPIDVVVDLGRMRTMHEGVCLRSVVDRIVLLTGSSLSAIAAARSAIGELASQTQVECLVIGPGRPYSAAEISKALGIAVVGNLPFDPDAAAALNCGNIESRRLTRSPLLRSVRVLATTLWEPANPREVAHV